MFNFQLSQVEIDRQTENTDKKLKLLNFPGFDPGKEEQIEYWVCYSVGQ